MKSNKFWPFEMSKEDQSHLDLIFRLLVGNMFPYPLRWGFVYGFCENVDYSELGLFLDSYLYWEGVALDNRFKNAYEIGESYRTHLPWVYELMAEKVLGRCMRVFEEFSLEFPDEVTKIVEEAFVKLQMREAVREALEG